MSEILRGVLDASCAFSAPTFYSVTFPQLNNAIVPPPRTSVSAFLQTKSDRWFLMTGIAFFWVSSGVAFNNPSNGLTFDLFNVNTRKSFLSNSAASNSALMNGTSADFMTLPEYIEFQPNDVIGLRAETDTRAADFWTFAVLAGLEYAK